MIWCDWKFITIHTFFFVFFSLKVSSSKLIWNIHPENIGINKLTYTLLSLFSTSDTYSQKTSNFATCDKGEKIHKFIKVFVRKFDILPFTRYNIVHFNGNKQFDAIFFCLYRNTLIFMHTFTLFYASLSLILNFQQLLQQLYQSFHTMNLLLKHNFLSH